MFVTLRQPGTGKLVSVKVGFSWFFLLLTPFYGLPQFIKGIWGHGCLVLFLYLVLVGLAAAGAAPLGGLILIGLAIFYGVQGNKLVARRLLIKGWTMEGDEHALAYAKAQWGLGA